MPGDDQAVDEGNLTAGETGEAQSGGEHPAGAAEGSRACMPCRGTGRVTSNLGGSASDVPCPWCAGTGERQAGVDAQAAWLERES